MRTISPSAGLTRACRLRCYVSRNGRQGVPWHAMPNTVTRVAEVRLRICVLAKSSKQVSLGPWTNARLEPKLRDVNVLKSMRG